jgi:hypothetical protein
VELLDRLRREETLLPVLDHSGDGNRGPVDGFEKSGLLVIIELRDSYSTRSTYNSMEQKQGIFNMVHIVRW